MQKSMMIVSIMLCCWRCIRCKVYQWYGSLLLCLCRHHSPDVHATPILQFISNSTGPFGVHSIPDPTKSPNARLCRRPSRNCSWSSRLCHLCSGILLLPFPRRSYQNSLHLPSNLCSMFLALFIKASLGSNSGCMLLQTIRKEKELASPNPTACGLAHGRREWVRRTRIGVRECS